MDFRKRLRDYNLKSNWRFLVVNEFRTLSEFEGQESKPCRLVNSILRMKRKTAYEWTLLDLRLMTLHLLDSVNIPSFLFILGADPAYARAMLCSSNYKSNEDWDDPTRIYNMEQCIFLEKGAEEGLKSLETISLSP